MDKNYLTKLFALSGKTAVVIGGGGHLCGEMARGLALAGVSVAVLDIHAKKKDKIISQIHKDGGNATGFVFEATEKESHEDVLKKVLKEYKKVDILINGAGINAPTPVMDITAEEWHAIIDSHVTATLFGCQVFGAHMIKKRKGSIINMSSASSGPPLSKAFTYSVAKAGIKNLTQNLAREWAPFNVRVNAMKPGFFPTKWSMKNFITKKRESAILNHTPMHRYGDPKDLLGAVLWLASDGSKFVTGSEVTVDGGFSCMTI